MREGESSCQLDKPKTVLCFFKDFSVWMEMINQQDNNKPVKLSPSWDSHDPDYPAVRPSDVKFSVNKIKIIFGFIVYLSVYGAIFCSLC